ncbi:phage virion morphogenesis protein [Methylomonas sp. EFPC1]|uniref:phage virion morphogenesis protein n=1 Tax=Methylomonas sp. EFPC1 TaxID=2812647 RepID=UPI0019674DF1|nr:phage virion morphogenesis protein [Methylomonas sp. EFPC1]QSB01975.1 phage virion morphogenesis protein [Methylomonas sp. EFPC1]
MTPIVVDVVGKLKLDQQLALLKMPLAKRARLLKKVSNKVIRDSRKRVQTQTDLQGMPYKKRWKQRKDRRKMLSRLMRQAAVLSNDGSTARIGFKGRAGWIAARQQFGASETVTAKAGGDGTKRTAKNGPATKRQAATLKALGFKISTGKRKRAVSMAWIQQNMTIARAGAIIRSMRLKRGIRPNTSWNTVLPARSFLGATDQEVMQYIQDIFDDINQEISRVR